MELAYAQKILDGIILLNNVCSSIVDTSVSPAAVQMMDVHASISLNGIALFASALSNVTVSPTLWDSKLMRSRTVANVNREAIGNRIHTFV